MRVRWIAIPVVAALAIGCAYAEFGLDLRAPRADVKISGALSTNTNYSLREFNALSERLTAEYGDRVQVSFQPGKITVELDGKVIEERDTHHRLADVLGVLGVTNPDGSQDVFPFQLAPEHGLDSIERRLAERMKNRFGDDVPQWMLAFSDHDLAIGNCATLTAQQIGWSMRLLRYSGGTACIVGWKAKPVSMLISVSRAEGDPWMRPFTRWICRAITQAALQAARGDAAIPAPTYAGCMLADRPGRKGVADSLSSHLYKVLSGGALAFIK